MQIQWLLRCTQVLERMEGRSASWQLQLPHAVHPAVEAERAIEVLGGTAAHEHREGDVEGDGYVSDDDEDLFGGPRY